MNEIIVALIGLCATIITTVVVPWFNAKLKNEKLQNILTIVSEYVKAAEELLGAGSGVAKKEMVIKLLTAKGITVDENLEAIIEAAVYSLTQIKDKIELPKVG